MNKPNPFRNRNVIKSEEGLANRKQETEEIYSLLLDQEDMPQSIALIGQRRIGKSSLLYRIYKKWGVDEIYSEELKKTLMIMVDFSSLSDCSPDIFFERLINEIEINETNDEMREIVATYSGKSLDPSESFRQIINKLDREGFRVIVLLDEFDGIVNNPALNKPFFDKLRSFMQYQRLAYVLALQQSLHLIWGPTSINSPHTSPFFNPFHTIYLKGFDLSFVGQYLQSKFSFAGQSLLKTDLDNIIKMGGNFPFFVNIAAEKIFDQLIPSVKLNWSFLQEELANDNDITANFEYFWTHLSENQKKTLWGICKNRVIQTPEADKDIKWLEKMSLIYAAENKYVPFSDLFRDFILRQNLPIEEIPIQPVPEISLDQLTDQEINVLHLLIKNWSNKQIAVQLTISENTVKTHVSNILGKFGVDHRGKAKDIAIKLGIT